MSEDGEEDGGLDFVVLTGAEVERCMSVITDMQHRAIFQLMVDTGMSVDEIIGNEELGTPGIYIQNIRSRELYIEVTYRFRADDRFATRTIPISAASFIVIKDWLLSLGRSFHDEERVFKIGKRRVKQFFQELDGKMDFGKKITMYTLRRTAMVNMLKQGIKPDEVRRRMGFIRDREDRVLCAMSYILMDEEHYENLLRSSLINAVLQPSTLPMIGVGASGGSLASAFCR